MSYTSVAIILTLAAVLFYGAFVLYGTWMTAADKPYATAAFVQPPTTPATSTPARTTMTPSTVLCLLALLAIASRGSAYAQATGRELTEDRAHRDTAIHWPNAFNPSVAPVFSHNELLLHTDCHHAFTHLADAPHWPDWFLLTRNVSIEGPQQPVHNGTHLRLKIFNSPIQSRIVEFTPDSRISWIPFGACETETRHGHYHAWHFIPESPNCRVVTEETGIGPGDLKDPPAGSHLMQKAYALWLASLQYAAEP